MNTKHRNRTNRYDIRHVIDAPAEKYFSESPYNYAGNNPVSRTDFMGLDYQSIQDIINMLWNSEYGGTWTNTGGGGSFSFFSNTGDALQAGVDYNNYFGSWENTEFSGGARVVRNSPTRTSTRNNFTGKRMWANGNGLLYNNRADAFTYSLMANNFTSTFPDDGDPPDGGNGKISFGGIMFYDENGHKLYVSGKGDKNIIYIVKNKDVNKLLASVAKLDIKYSPINEIELNALASLYAQSSYTPFIKTDYNGNPAVFGGINAPWYIYAIAGMTTVMEGFSAGYSAGSAYSNYNKWRYEGLSNHYSSSLNYGVKNIWAKYFEIKTFDPWW